MTLDFLIEHLPFMMRLYILYALVLDVIFAVIGIVLSFTKSFHRIGIRMIGVTNIFFWVAPYFCRCRCDGTCKTPVCPRFQKDPGKFEVTDK